MEREQIIKALECCGEMRECSTCPRYDRNNDLCEEDLHADALSLIKELTEENEQFRYEQRKLIEERDVLREYAYNMQKCVENIKHNEEAGYEPSAARYVAEMEMWHVVALKKKKLTAENERLRDTAYRLECEVHRERADTVRKMQERLLEKFKDWLGIPYIIDKIAKEMVEEKT